jgi:predicted TPR repeat methyltransferase
VTVTERGAAAFPEETALSSVAALKTRTAPAPTSDRAEPSGSAAVLPEIVASVDRTQAAARIAIWRAGDAEFEASLNGGEGPSAALRRIALRRWSAGQTRLASVMLATAAAIDPERSEIWLDLGFTLQAFGETRQAALALEQALKLDPKPARSWLALGLAANQLGDAERAETGFRAALERDPSLTDAAFGLALVAFDQRRYEDAAEAFRKALSLGATAPLARVGLGQSLFFLGEFAAAAAQLRMALDAGIADPNLIRRAALAQYLACVGEGDYARAERAYAEIAGVHGEDAVKTAFAAFQILVGYGRRDEALALARARLPGREADPVQRYLVKAAAGANCARAPEDYVIAHFDAFAEDFDRQLVGVLGYRAPQQLLELIGPAGASLRRVLDLGCGTGLAGPLLREGRQRLVGVDLSPRMLAKAGERSVYDELIEAEMIGFLRRTKERFDLLFCADALVYFGDLAPIFASAARVTGPGALFAFNIETTNAAAYELKASGRFAHDLANLSRVAEPWFRVRNFQRAALRREGFGETRGALVIMERRGQLLRSAVPGSGSATLAA